MYLGKPLGKKFFNRYTIACEKTIRNPLLMYCNFHFAVFSFPLDDNNRIVKSVELRSSYYVELTTRQYLATSPHGFFFFFLRNIFYISIYCKFRAKLKKIKG